MNPVILNHKFYFYAVGNNSINHSLARCSNEWPSNLLERLINSLVA
jgi:hypothetical protein